MESNEFTHLNIKNFIETLDGSQAKCLKCHDKPPAYISKVEQHVRDAHFKKVNGEEVIFCKLLCLSSKKPHYHCNVCPKMFDRVDRFRAHIPCGSVNKSLLNKENVPPTKRFKSNVSVNPKQPPQLHPLQPPALQQPVQEQPNLQPPQLHPLVTPDVQNLSSLQTLPVAVENENQKNVKCEICGLVLRKKNLKAI